MQNILKKLKTIKLWDGILFSCIVGIIIGIFTVLGQGILPGNWNSLANSGAVWLIPAFFIGAIGSTKIKSAIFSIISLWGMVTGYYAYAILINKIPESTNYIILWSVIAIIGGLIFGLGGFFWSNANKITHIFGSAIIGGVFITEGMNMIIHINDYRHMINVGYVEIIGGFLLVIVLERTNKDRISSLVALLPIIMLGIIAYQVLYYLTI